MMYLLSLAGISILVSSMVPTVPSLPVKLVAAISLNDVTFGSNNNNNNNGTISQKNDNDNSSIPVQIVGKVNVSIISHNSTQMTNSPLSINPKEIHKPLSPKSQQEIQNEKEQIQKCKLNTTIFTQRLPGAS